MQIALWLMLLSVACQQATDREVVAQVGEVQLTAAQVRQLVLALPPGLRSAAQGQEARRDYLQTLIDRELMLATARARGLDRDPELLAQFEARRRDRLVALYRKREVLSRAVVSDEEISRYFAEQGWTRERLVGTILVDSEQKATQLQAQIRGGARFEELARQHSLDPRSAQRGGELGFMPRPLAERIGVPGRVFDSLATGQISPPIAQGRNYHLVRFLADRPAELQTYAGQIKQLLLKEKRRDLEAQQVELLAYQRHWQLAPAGVEALRRWSGPGRQFTPEEKQTPLFTYTGGQVGVGDYLEMVKINRIPPARALQDTAAMAAIGRRFLLPRVMLLEAAKQAGIPEEAEVGRWEETIKEELLLKQVRQKEVSSKVEVSEEEVQRYYREHADQFRLPEIICFDELVVADGEEARRFKEELGADANLLELARERGYPTRQLGPDSLACMSSLEKAVYPTLWEALKVAPLGELGGPVAVEGGYSLFKVVRREGPQAEPYEQAVARARAQLRERAVKQNFAQWTAGLRREYQAQIQIFEERLAEALPEALLVGSTHAEK